MKNLMKFIGLALLAITLSFINVDKKIIVIDASHGGQDNGTSIEEITEKEITFEIANKIKELNKNPNIKIILTRNSDKFLSLNERVKLINDLTPDYVISLHANASDNISEGGKEIFISDKNNQKGKSGNLAIELFYGFNEINVKIKKADFYLLENVECPIALVELGYLTNESDRNKLKSEKGQTEIAESILNVIK